MKRYPLVAPIFAALALAALCVSCWSPYYDPKVSKAVPFYKKLGAPFLSIGPLSDTAGMSDPKGSLEFLPTRPGLDPLDPTDGFLVWKGDDAIRIGFVEFYGGAYRLAPSMQSRPNAIGSAALARSEAAKGATPELILMCDNATAEQYSFDSSTHSVNPTASAQIPASASVLGVGARLLMPPSADTDTYAALFSDGTRNIVAMDAIGADLNGFSNQVSATLDLGGRTLIGGGSAFLDPPNHRFYYSPPGGPTLLWDTTAWAASSAPPTELPISERLTALLSDGTLVAQGDTYLTAYSAEGKKLFSTPAGSVRLEHEVYFSGTTPAEGNYLLFSQVLSVQGSSGWEFYIDVWRYPVADFASLGN
jgi:hypothetical protein